MSRFSCVVAQNKMLACYLCLLFGVTEYWVWYSVVADGVGVLVAFITLLLLLDTPFGLIVKCQIDPFCSYHSYQYYRNQNKHFRLTQNEILKTAKNHQNLFCRIKILFWIVCVGTTNIELGIQHPH